MTDAYFVSVSSDWQKAYERAVVWCLAGGGLAMGLALLFLSPPGWDSIDVVGALAVGVGVVATTDLLLGRGRPLPYLVVSTVLIGGVAILVDDALAMALNAVLVAVLAAGALLIRPSRGFWAFTALSVVAISMRPVLSLLGREPLVSLTAHPAITWVVAATGLLTGAAGFRVLRERIVLRDEYHAEVNHLVSSLAHRLRTPLTGMLGFGHLIGGEVLTDDGQDFAQKIIENGWELSSTLDDLVIAARSTTDGLQMLKQPVVLGSMVNEVIGSVRGATEKLSYSSVAGTAIGDPVRIRQILRHLVTNAVEHGGSSFVVHSRIDDNGVTVSIVDDGPGLVESDQTRAFDWYFTRSGDRNTLGAGIGLSVSRVLAEAMGGSLDLAHDHSGTTATLRLPADPRSIRSSAIWPPTAKQTTAQH